jgi:hypothetical protein
MIKNRNFQLPQSFHEILAFLLLTELKGNSYLFCVVIIHASHSDIIEGIERYFNLFHFGHLNFFILKRTKQLVHITRLQKTPEYLSRKRERIPNGFPIILEVEVRSKILHENNFSFRNLFYQKIFFFPTYQVLPISLLIINHLTFSA